MPSNFTFSDLFAMSSSELQAIMQNGYPLDPDSMAGSQYLGADLSMGKLGQKLLWKTFRKTFVRDEAHGDIRGWNVRMEQRGIHGAQVPMRNKAGEPKTFAHYRIRPATGMAWPKGWHGADYFDYRIAGNPLGEALATTPVVAVNDGSSDLILGWEVFNIGGRCIAPPLYWALTREGPVDFIAQPKHTPKLR